MSKLELRFRLVEFTSVAALLVTLATLVAAVAWISSGRARGTVEDLRTAALGFMILRLEAATETSTALVQAQTYLTQAGMYYAEAESIDDEQVAAYLTGLGDQSLELSNFHADRAQQAEQKTQVYFGQYEAALDRSAAFARDSDYRSTAALILNVSAAVASASILIKKRALLIVFAPIFLLGLAYLLASLL
jgi:hypothetical protein